MNKILRNHVAYTVFVVPALILYITFFLVPLFTSMRYSLTSWDGVNTPDFNGIDNFIKAFQDPDFWISFKNNLYFVLFSIFIQVPIILVSSILISGVKRFLNFYKITVFLPSILSTAAIGIIWKFIYAPDAGLLNQILRGLGLDDWTRLWLGDENTVMLSILITNGWQWTGFYIVLVLAGIFAIPKEIMEAGEIDGAVGWRKAMHLTLPLIRPVIVVTLLLSITGAMKALDIVMIMTNGGPYGSSEVMATFMYKQAYSMSDFGYANAISIIITIFTAILTLLYQIINNRTKEAEY